jgi:hypothetical protein
MGCLRIIRGLGISDVWPLPKLRDVNAYCSATQAVGCIGPGHGAITIGPWSFHPKHRTCPKDSRYARKKAAASSFLIVRISTRWWTLPDENLG